MAVYEPGCHPQTIIWTEAKLRSIYYFVGDRPVHKLPFGPRCHELFVILYSIHANLSDDMFFTASNSGGLLCEAWGVRFEAFDLRTW